MSGKHTCLHGHLRKNTYIYTHTHTHIYIYIYRHTHTHTNTHTCAVLCTQLNSITLKLVHQEQTQITITQNRQKEQIKIVCKIQEVIKLANAQNNQLTGTGL